MNRIQLNGVNIDCIKKDELISFIDNYLDSISSNENRPLAIFTPNPEIILKAKQNKQYLNILNTGDLMLPDGHGLLFVSTLLQLKSRLFRFICFIPALILFLFYKKAFHQIIPEVIHGSDFTDEIIKMSVKRSLSVYFLGAKKNNAEKTAHYFLNKYPKLIVSGFSNSDPSEISVSLLNKFRPDVLLVAYGAPKQEMFINDFAGKVSGLKIAMAVGGTFDFYSGEIHRAPKLFRVIGLEWFWRLLNQPSRIIRIFNAVIVFPIKTIFSY